MALYQTVLEQKALKDTRNSGRMFYVEQRSESPGTIMWMKYSVEVAKVSIWHNKNNNEWTKERKWHILL